VPEVSGVRFAELQFEKFAVEEDYGMWLKACLVVGLMFSSVAMAGNWGTQTTITGYYVYDDGYAYIKTTNNENPDNCQYSAYLGLDPNKPNFKAIWAQVIAAQSMGTTVSLRYEGCIGPYPKVMAIAIPNVW
jgi:hypothetical protein